MNTQRLCFNCGVPIGRKLGNETVEHVPLRSLFDGFGDEYKINRITVPCCLACNSETSKVIDEEFRNFIGSIGEGPTMMEITEKTLRSVLNHKKQFDRIHFDDNGRVGLLSKMKLIHEYLQKVVRGLFFHSYRQIVPTDCIVGVDFDKEKHGEMSTRYINYLLRNFEYKHSGSPDIFKYILQPYRENFSQQHKADLVRTPGDIWFVVLMVFHNTFSAMGYISFTAKRR